MNRVMAVRDYSFTPGRGGSRPHRMLCDDEKEYMVKFADHGARASINEAIAGDLAAEVCIPTPGCALVEISRELIDQSAALTQRTATPGFYFGSQLEPRAFDLNNPMSAGIQPSQITNREDAAAIVGFDNWVRNTDRGNNGNLLLLPGSGEGGAMFRLLAIDHGLILGGARWDATSLEAQSSSGDIVAHMPFLDRCIWSSDDFRPVTERVGGADHTRLGECCDSVPAAWPFTEEDKAAVVRFLVTRRDLLSGILDTFPVTGTRPLTSPADSRGP